MFTTLFLSVLQLSVQSSFFFLVIYFLRVLLRFLGAPRLLNHFLWCALIFQLLCPFRIPVELFTYATPIIESTVTRTTTTLSQTLPQLVYNNEAILATESVTQTISPVTTFESLLCSIFNSNYILLALTIVWAIGVLILGVRGATQYNYLRRSIQLAYRVQEGQRIYYTGTGVNTPFILGIFKPRIYLPTITDSTEKSYIYHHEKAHLTHCDFLLKPLFYLALSIHWFNPLVWFCMSQMAEDIEGACDETVLARFSDKIKTNYCNSLLRFAHAPRYATMPLCFGEGHFTKRIKNILDYKKPTFWAICSGGFLAVIVCVICLFNPFSTTTNRQNINSNTQNTSSSAISPTPSLTATPQPTQRPSASATPTPLCTSIPLIVMEEGETPSPTDIETSMSFLWPVPDYYSVSRWQDETHNGADIVADSGTNIYASAGGTIVAAGYNAAGTGFGYSVIIDHGDSWTTLYAHGLNVYVDVGDVVSQGDLIMQVGNTGRSNGNHLHFEIFLQEYSLELKSIFPTTNTVTVTTLLNHSTVPDEPSDAD